MRKPTTQGPAAALTREDLGALGLHARYDLLKGGSFTAAEQELVLEIDDGDTLEAFAANPHLSEESQAALAVHPGEHVRESLAANTSVCAEVQEVLVRDAARDVRWQLAANTAATPAVQLLLSQDDEGAVRYVLAENPEVMPEVLAVLALDPDEGARANAARNPKVTQDLALVLASDSRTRVRDALARNPAVELSEVFPLACLELSDRGRDLVERVLADSGVDPEASDALRGGWSGTLAELVAAAGEFSAAPA
jgi:hypothetical protein